MNDDAIPTVTPEQPADAAPIIAPDYSEDEIAWATRAVSEYEKTVTHNPFIRKDLLHGGMPHPKQQEFLLHSFTKEVFYGGAGGGGKTLALLMAALQYVQVPGYNALILRNTFPDLNKPNGPIPTSKTWLMDLADWKERDRCWRFPSGATLTFGYLERYDDALKYRGGEWQFIAFDELTLWADKESYLFLFSRLRKTLDLNVPLRMRATSNPGGPGHMWVRERFILDHTREKGALFIPAKIADNPSLDRADYEQSLSHLDPVTRAQIMDGDWEVSEEGRFKIGWFRNGRYSHDTYHNSFQLHSGAIEVGNGIRINRCTIFVTVDLAASVKTSADYTVFLACAVTPWQQLLVLDVQRKKHPVDQIPSNLRDFCNNVAKRFGQPVAWAGVEANGMQIGIADACRRMSGMVPVRYLKPANQDKLARAQKAIIAAEQGRIFLPLNASWLDDFIYELIQFTGDPKKDSHDDAVDALSYAVLNMSFAAFEAPSFGGRAGEEEVKESGSGRRGHGLDLAGRVSDSNEGMSRIFRRDGRMRRLFGGGS